MQMIKKSEYSQYLVLLDKGTQWNGTSAWVVHWREMNVPGGHRSIPLMVEDQAEILRKEYLAWVHDLGEYCWRGRSLKEHLRFGGISFWWMTLIAEKSPMKTPAIYEVFKLRVLEQFYLSSGCQGIVLCSGDPLLNRVLSDWCRSMGHPYRWKRYPKSRAPRRLRERLRLLPYPVQALATLVRHLWSRRRHLSAVNALPAGSRQVTVLTYFPNIDRSIAEKGIFRSRYWGDLHDVLDRGPWTVNWIWLYAASNECSFSEARNLRRRFNEEVQGRARHFFLEEFMTTGVLLHTVLLYLRLMVRGIPLKSIRNAFRFPGSSLNFWPILADDWRTSLYGPGAMGGSLMLETFRSLAKRLPRQDWGLYLCENQPWERALIAAWRASGHGRLIGFQHSTLRFLDLRFFEDPRSYHLVNDPPLLPEILVVNGNGALKLLQEADFPREKIVIAEAVRYIFLDRFLAKKPEADLPKVANKHTLLVVTGSLVRETSSQLYLLAKAARRRALDGYGRILVKPHPDCPVDEILKNVAPDLEVTVVVESLMQLLPQASTVYTANSTSASVEAVLIGLPVLVHVVEDNINLSPLYGQPGVKHVRTVEDLIQGLISPNFSSVSPDYFCLDEGLPRWQRLLKN